MITSIQIKNNNSKKAIPCEPIARNKRENSRRENVERGAGRKSHGVCWDGNRLNRDSWREGGGKYGGERRGRGKKNGGERRGRYGREMNEVRGGNVAQGEACWLKGRGKER